MRRALAVTVALILVAVGVAIAASPRAPETVYSVAALRNGVTAAPARWSGRTVLVRGIAIGLYGPNCAPGSWCAFGLLDPGAPLDDTTVLRLQPQVAGALIATLRRAPGVSQLLPAPQELRWGRLAVYRVQIQRLPAASCPTHRCYRVVLPDAPAPGPGGVFVSSTQPDPRASNK
jgi:hypothetical protein